MFTSSAGAPARGTIRTVVISPATRTGTRSGSWSRRVTSGTCSQNASSCSRSDSSTDFVMRPTSFFSAIDPSCTAG
jgi:hypothetical protein